MGCVVVIIVVVVAGCGGEEEKAEGECVMRWRVFAGKGLCASESIGVK